MRVGFFVTCLVDLMRPSIGFAAIRLLEAGGAEVFVPPSQTCCGQPGYNSGDRAGAIALARKLVGEFEACDYLVAPSGSCTGMIKTHYGDLFRDDPPMLGRAEALAARTFELTDFLVNVLKAEGVPHHKRIWHERYRAIVHLEDHLSRNGTAIAKFFLHLSKEEQRKRFLARIDDPEKNWKFGAGDLAERAFWKDYMKAYGHCLGATSTPAAPWYVVPADDKENARLIVSQIVLETLDGLKMAYPQTTAARRKELLAIRRALMK